MCVSHDSNSASPILISGRGSFATGRLQVLKKDALGFAEDITDVQKRVVGPPSPLDGRPID
jgi:hypothetical protein